MQIFKTTERLILREILESDAQDFFEMDSDPAVHKFLGNQPVQSIAESEAIIQNVRQQYADFGIGRWAVVDKNNGAFMGWAGIKFELNSRTGLRYYDLGYRFKRAYWGKNIATEAARACLHYGFNQMGLTELFAAAHVENLASNAILKKLGFQLIDQFESYGALQNWYGIRQ